MTSTLRRRSIDVLSEIIVSFVGLRIVDVGCGDGTLVRALTRLGAQAVGIECGDAVLERARATLPVGQEIYLQGEATLLPLENESVDVVVFFNSLHHVPLSHQPTALVEAARVLTPGGKVIVHEPLAEGPFFDLIRPVEDETAARCAAYQTIRTTQALRFEQELFYLNSVCLQSYEDLATRLISAESSRVSLVAKQESRLRADMQRLGELNADGAYIFDQPSRINIGVK
ncbi:Class I SAM-dependent methyltransferase [Azospirillaceae bacterium]